MSSPFIVSSDLKAGIASPMTNIYNSRSIDTNVTVSLPPPELSTQIVDINEANIINKIPILDSLNTKIDVRLRKLLTAEANEILDNLPKDNNNSNVIVVNRNAGNNPDVFPIGEVVEDVLNINTGFKKMLYTNGEFNNYESIKEIQGESTKNIKISKNETINRRVEGNTTIRRYSDKSATKEDICNENRTTVFDTKLDDKMTVKIGRDLITTEEIQGTINRYRYSDKSATKEDICNENRTTIFNTTLDSDTNIKVGNDLTENIEVNGKVNITGVCNQSVVENYTCNENVEKNYNTSNNREIETNVGNNYIQKYYIKGNGIYLENIKGNYLNTTNINSIYIKELKLKNSKLKTDCISNFKDIIELSNATYELRPIKINDNDCLVYIKK